MIFYKIQWIFLTWISTIYQAFLRREIGSGKRKEAEEEEGDIEDPMNMKAEIIYRVCLFTDP